MAAPDPDGIGLPEIADASSGSKERLAPRTKSSGYALNDNIAQIDWLRHG